jgi:hypothetical protein
VQKAPDGNAKGDANKRERSLCGHRAAMSLRGSRAPRHEGGACLAAVGRGGKDTKKNLSSLNGIGQSCCDLQLPRVRRGRVASDMYTKPEPPHPKPLGACANAE